MKRLFPWHKFNITFIIERGKGIRWVTLSVYDYFRTFSFTERVPVLVGCHYRPFRIDPASSLGERGVVTGQVGTGRPPRPEQVHKSKGVVSRMTKEELTLEVLLRLRTLRRKGLNECQVLPCHFFWGVGIWRFPLKIVVETFILICKTISVPESLDRFPLLYQNTNVKTDLDPSLTPVSFPFSVLVLKNLFSSTISVKSKTCLFRLNGWVLLTVNNQRDVIL